AKEVAEGQREQQDILFGELSGVLMVTDENRQGLDSVRESVNGIEQEVATTRQGLANTEDLLYTTQGAVNEVRDQVGSHASEIAELRRRGEKEIVDFTLETSKERQRVDDVLIRLKDT